MTDKLIVKTYEKAAMNGDRASHTSPYKDYQLVLVLDDEETELAYINGYDGFWSHIHNEKEVLNDLGKEVEKFEKIFGVKAVGLKLVKKVTVTEEWIEDNE